MTGDTLLYVLIAFQVTLLVAGVVAIEVGLRRSKWGEASQDWLWRNGMRMLKLVYFTPLLVGVYWLTKWLS